METNCVNINIWFTLPSQWCTCSLHISITLEITLVNTVKHFCKWLVTITTKNLYISTTHYSGYWSDHWCSISRPSSFTMITCRFLSFIFRGERGGFSPLLIPRNHLRTEFDTLPSLPNIMIINVFFWILHLVEHYLLKILENEQMHYWLIASLNQGWYVFK